MARLHKGLSLAVFVFGSLASAPAMSMDASSILIQAIFPQSRDAYASFQSFIQSAAALKFPTGFLQQTTSGLSGVMILDSSQLSGAAAAYYPELNKIAINAQMYDTDSNEVRPMSPGQMAYQDGGIVIHELWHSYKQNFFGNQAESAEFASHAQTLFADYPSDVREEILDECYGLYTQAITGTYFNIRHTLMMATPEVRQKLRKNPVFTKTSYEDIFTAKYNGYYQAEAGQPTWVPIPMMERDKQILIQSALKWPITGKFEMDFADLL